jgi:hypothetical protein
VNATRRRAIEELRRMVLAALGEHDAEVWLFGSCENVSAASPNATIRAARALGWLSDEDAQAVIKLGEERNLAVQMYRDQVGQQIEGHLAAHAALLRRWLEALQRRAAAE